MAECHMAQDSAFDVCWILITLSIIVHTCDALTATVTIPASSHNVQMHFAWLRRVWFRSTLLKSNLWATIVNSQTRPAVHLICRSFTRNASRNNTYHTGGDVLREVGGRSRARLTTLIITPSSEAKGAKKTILISVEKSDIWLKLITAHSEVTHGSEKWKKNCDDPGLPVT